MIKINGVQVKNERFPDNTLLVSQLNFNVTDGIICITWLYDSDSEMFEIMCLLNTLKVNYPMYYFILDLPYVPNARMDRIEEKGESFTLKIFCEWLNDLHFDEVRTFDVHSNVTKALINHITDKSPNLDKVFEEYNPDLIFFPDEGACKRYSKLIKNKEIGFGIKHRDWKTGIITGYDIVADDVYNKNILIVDDICSKGTTFKYAALKLKESGAKDIKLYVSHCENTIEQGDLLNDPFISTIYTTDSICTIKHDKIKFIKEFRK